MIQKTLYINNDSLPATMQVDLGQFEENFRYIVITVLSSRLEPFDLSAYSARIQGKKTDGHRIFNRSTIVKNEIYIDITKQMTVLSGTYPLDVLLIHPDKQITILRMNMSITPSAAGDSELVSADEMTAISSIDTAAMNAVKMYVDAEYAASDFLVYKTASENARDAAAGSAQAASTSAGQAAASATQAAASATAASRSAGDASNSATSASRSAESASTSAGQASGSATAASESAGMAETAKESAVSAKESAETAKTDAQTAAGTATTKSSEAAQSATDAQAAKASLQASQATIANAVLKTSQALTDAEQAQARANISAQMQARNTGTGELVSLNDASPGNAGLKIYGKSVQASAGTTETPVAVEQSSLTNILNATRSLIDFRDGYKPTRTYADVVTTSDSVSITVNMANTSNGMWMLYYPTASEINRLIRRKLKVSYTFESSDAGYLQKIRFSCKKKDGTTLTVDITASDVVADLRQAETVNYIAFYITTDSRTFAVGDFAKYSNLSIIDENSYIAERTENGVGFSTVAAPSILLRGLNLGMTKPDKYTYFDDTNYWLSDVYDCETGVLTRNISDTLTGNLGIDIADPTATASYILAEPTTEQLAVTSISTLAGVNNICATGGTVAPYIELDYPLDLKIYTDNKYAELAAAIAANGGN